MEVLLTVAAYLFVIGCILFIPFMLYLIILVFGEKKKRLPIILASVLLGAELICAGILYERPIYICPESYASYISEEQANRLKAGNLPANRGFWSNNIPIFAVVNEVTYTPQFLQGGEVFELSYTTTDGNLAEWTALLEGKAEWVGSNQQWHAENSRSIPGTDSTRYHLYWDGGFNHGEMCYVLIDEGSNRITFYYSEW